MLKFLTLVMVSISLTGCMFVHKMDIEQGNVFSMDQVQLLHRGMTKAQVQQIMGSCILLNTFDDNRLSYVYTYQPGGREMMEKQVTLVFSKGVLKDIVVNCPQH